MSQNENQNQLLTQTSGYGVTQKYTPITTQSLIDQLVSEGYVQTQFKATKVRKASKEGFQKHLITLTHQNFLKIDQDVPTAVISNSYDGLSSLRLFAGLDVKICSNGLIMGKSVESYRLPHVGLTLERVLECLNKITASLPAVAEQIARFKSVQLSDAQIRDFASQLAALVVPETAREVNLETVTQVRRNGDSSASLWHVFNRGEESVIRGGIEYINLTQNETDKTFSVRNNTTRAVKSIDRRIELERAAWDLAEQFAA